MSKISNLSQETIRKIQSLFNASMAGDIEGVKLILSTKIHTIDGDLIDEEYRMKEEIDPKRWGRRPLHVAVIAGHVNIVEYLVENGANINIKTKYGDTALHFAVHYNRLELLKYLLDKGADHRILNNVNQSVLDIAKEQQKAIFIKILEELV